MELFDTYWFVTRYEQITDEAEAKRNGQHHEVVSSKQHTTEGRRDNVDDDRFARQLKELVTLLRDKVDALDQCTAVDQPCAEDDDDAGGPRCCRGLRCSTAGRCVLDCVSDGQSCRRNWFCCDGRRCNDDFVCE